jgi:hypothetical protein
MDSTTVNSARPYVARLSEMLKTAEGQRQCLEWMTSDYTQLMLGAAREISRPKAPRLLEPFVVGYEMGELVGANRIVDFFANPKSTAAVRNDEIKQPRPTYSAASVLKQQEGVGT